MKRDVIISCAVTGSGDSVGKHPDIPITPQHIADAAIEAARAGAAIAHIHVGGPKTGRPSRSLDHYREVVEGIRSTRLRVINTSSSVETLTALHRTIPFGHLISVLLEGDGFAFKQKC